MERLRFNIRSWGFVVFPAVLVFMIIFFSQSVATGYYEEKLIHTDAYSTMELKSILEDYQTKAGVLDTQIAEIKKDIDWLILKINRIQDAGKKAPHGLKDSVSAKDQKSKSLLKEKNRLETILSHYKKEFDSRKKIESDKIPAANTPKLQEASGTILAKTIPPKTSKSIIDPSNTIKTNTIKKAQVEAAVKKAGLEDWVEVNGDDTCLRIETTLPILFSSGSAKVSKEYQSFFKKLAFFLKPYDVKVLVNGYADTLPIHTKKYPSNFELGATRAANIIHELVKQGLKPSIFKIETTGEYRFAAKEPSKQKSFQRRAQVTVIFSG